MQCTILLLLLIKISEANSILMIDWLQIIEFIDAYHFNQFVLSVLMHSHSLLYQVTREQYYILISRKCVPIRSFCVIFSNQQALWKIQKFSLITQCILKF